MISFFRQLFIRIAVVFGFIQITTTEGEPLVSQQATQRSWWCPWRKNTYDVIGGVEGSLQDLEKQENEIIAELSKHEAKRQQLIQRAKGYKVNASRDRTVSSMLRKTLVELGTVNDEINSCNAILTNISHTMKDGGKRLSVMRSNMRSQVVADSRRRIGNLLPVSEVERLSNRLRDRADSTADETGEVEDAMNGWVDGNEMDTDEMFAQLVSEDEPLVAPEPTTASLLSNAPAVPSRVVVPPSTTHSDDVGWMLA